LDWLTKRWVHDHLHTLHPQPVLGDFLRLSYVTNRGVAFGLFSERGLPVHWVSLVALVVVLWLAFRPGARAWAHAVPLGLILGGALGNLLDRLRWGSVIDFIDVGVGGLRWWVFNLADASISVGVCLWALQLAFGRPRSESALSAVATSGAAATGDAASGEAPPGAPSDDARGA
jgi:signal peptidase II